MYRLLTETLQVAMAIQPNILYDIVPWHHKNHVMLPLTKQCPICDALAPNANPNEQIKLIKVIKSIKAISTTVESTFEGKVWARHCEGSKRLCLTVVAPSTLFDILRLPSAGYASKKARHSFCGFPLSPTYSRQLAFGSERYSWRSRRNPVITVTIK